MSNPETIINYWADLIRNRLETACPLTMPTLLKGEDPLLHVEQLQIRCSVVSILQAYDLTHQHCYWGTTFIKFCSVYLGQFQGSTQWHIFLLLDQLILKDADLKDIKLLRTGIAWQSDKKIKFQNPAGDLEQAFSKYAKPIAWKKPVYKLDTDPTVDNNGFHNEDFIVWMRTAALPTFRKLYRRIDHSQDGYANGMRNGTYYLDIVYSKYSISSL